MTSLHRFHTWVFVPVRKWGRPGCGSWSTHPSCRWRTGPITASAGGRCSCRTEGSDQIYIFCPAPKLLTIYFNPHCCTSPKKDALVTDKHADIFVFNHCTHPSGPVRASGLKTFPGLVTSVTGNHASGFLLFFLKNVFVRMSVSMSPAHTLWQRWRPETAIPQKYFSSCSCDPPGKEKHNSMIRFILVNVISSWSLGRPLSVGWFSSQTGHKYQPEKLAASQNYFSCQVKTASWLFITACRLWIYWYLQIWIKVLLLEYYMSTCHGWNQSHQPQCLNLTGRLGGLWEPGSSLPAPHTWSSAEYQANYGGCRGTKWTISLINITLYSIENVPRFH